MPRNSAGTYSLPAGNPVVTGTTISSSWANTTMSDIGTALTGSLARNGDGGMTGQFKAADGSVGAPGITWGNEATSGWYRIGSNQFGYSVNGTLSLSVGANRNWTIAAPASGANLTLSGIVNGTQLTVTDGTITAVLATAGGTRATWGSTSNHGLSLYTNSTERVIVASTGNVTVNAPSSGVALTVNGASATTAMTVNGRALLVTSSAAGDGVELRLQRTGGVTTDWEIYAPTGSTDLRLFSGSDRVIFGAAGNTTFNAPSSGQTLTIVAASNQPIAVNAGAGLASLAEFASNGNTPLTASFAVGQDSGGSGVIYNRRNGPVYFGTNSSTRFQIGASGGVEVFLSGVAPSGGNMGDGTINVGSGAFVGGTRLGWMDVLRRTSGFSRGECLAISAGVTLNTSDMAAGYTFSVYNDSASAITITQGAGVTLRLHGSSSTGNRTLAARGFATIWCNTSSEGVIMGDVT